MSFLLMARAMKSDIPDCYAKWLMVALCDHANEESHQCWPSLDLLAKRTAMNRTTVTRKLNWLEDNGWIQRKRGNNRRSTLYTVYPTLVAQCNSIGAESNTNLSYKPKQIIKEQKMIPDDWKPSDELMLRLKEEGGNIDYDYEINQFRDYHNAKGSKFKDINRAFQYWLRNSIKWNADRTSNQTSTRGKQSNRTRQKPSFFNGIYTRITDTDT